MILQAAFCNVPTSVGHAAWVECFEATAERAPIIGFCEVFSRRAKRAMIRHAPRFGLSQTGIFKGPNPIFWDTAKYAKVHSNHYQLHGARRSRWRGFNAARFANVVVLRPHEDGPDVTVVCTHWVPRGPKVVGWWRAKARRVSRDKVAHIVTAHRARGRVVVVMGDFNMDANPDLPGVEWLHGHGVDKVGVAVPKGYDMTGGEGHTYRAPTDHRRGVAASAWIAPTRRAA